MDFRPSFPPIFSITEAMDAFVVGLMPFCLYCRFSSTSPRKGFKAAVPSSGI